MVSDEETVHCAGMVALLRAKGDWREAATVLITHLADDAGFAAAAARTWPDWIAQMVLLRVTAESRIAEWAEPDDRADGTSEGAPAYLRGGH